MGIEPGSLDNESQPLTIGPLLTPFYYVRSDFIDTQFCNKTIIIFVANKPIYFFVPQSWENQAQLGQCARQ